MEASRFSKPGFSRRNLLKGMAVAGAGLAAGHVGAGPVAAGAPGKHVGAAPGAAGASGKVEQQGEPQYSLWYLEYSNAPTFPVSGILYGAHNKGTFKIPLGYVIIKGTDTLAVFDTGFRDSGKGGELGKAFGIQDVESTETVLGKIGLSPADVQHAFIGHAHFDHMDNIPGFPNAHVYVQAREITEWMNALQLPKQLDWVTGALNPQDLLDVTERSLAGQVTLVDGEMLDVLPGISIFPAHDTHTFGAQYITVTNGSGSDAETWLMASDSVYAYANVEGGAFGLPAGVYVPLGYGQGNQVTQLEKMDEMVQRVGGNTSHIVPGHDDAIFQRFPSKQVGPNRVAELRLAPGEPSRL